MKNLLRRSARRVYFASPHRVRKALDNVIGFQAIRRFTKSHLQLPPEIAQWQSQYRRPVSIVIPSYNDLEYLRACLQSIEATCEDFEYEVHVIDDYCQPEVQRKLKQLETSRIQVHLKSVRQGFAASVNVGMEAAQYDIILLNSDTVALPGWLDALQYSAYARDRRIGLVSGKLIYPNGRVQYGGTYHAQRFAPQWFSHLYVGSNPSRDLANVPTYNFGASGACMYVTRSLYSELGGVG